MWLSPRAARLCLVSGSFGLENRRRRSASGRPSKVFCKISSGHFHFFQCVRRRPGPFFLSRSAHPQPAPLSCSGSFPLVDHGSDHTPKQQALGSRILKIINSHHSQAKKSRLVQSSRVSASRIHRLHSAHDFGPRRWSFQHHAKPCSSRGCTFIGHVYAFEIKSETAQTNSWGSQSASAG